MTTNENDTLYKRQKNEEQHNANGEKKKLLKDSVIAKVMGSATAGMAVGVGAAYAAEHLHKDAENDPVSPEEQAQQNGPTAEERLAELEEKVAFLQDKIKHTQFNWKKNKENK